MLALFRFSSRIPYFIINMIAIGLSTEVLYQTENVSLIPNFISSYDERCIPSNMSSAIYWDNMNRLLYSIYLYIYNGKIYWLIFE